jgi:hypothetical protein
MFARVFFGGKKPCKNQLISILNKAIYILFLGVSNPLSLSSSSALHFFQIFFLCHHLVNRNDWHLLSLAKTSDFSVV